MVLNEFSEIGEIEKIQNRTRKKVYTIFVHQRAKNVILIPYLISVYGFFIEFW